VLCQRRTEPAMRGILDTATDAGLRALVVCRNKTRCLAVKAQIKRPSSPVEVKCGLKGSYPIRFI